VTREVDGTWTDRLDGFHITQLEATRELALIAGRAGARAEIRAARWEHGALRVYAYQPVPLPRWREPYGEVSAHVAIDESARSPRVAVNRREEQGGSFGIVVYPNDEIAPPTGEADVGFGVPLILRGDDLYTVAAGFSVNPDEAFVYHYRRAGGGAWSRSELHVPDRALTVGWQLALSPDASLLVATASDDEGTESLELFERRPSGFVHARSVPLAAEPTGVVFTHDALLVGLMNPTPEGAGVLVFDKARVELVGRISVPLETNGTAVHALDAEGDLAIVAQIGSLWAIDLRERRVARRLRLPARADERPPRPIAAVFGDHVLASVDDRVGVYSSPELRP
jgi:hypothetical protein